MARRTILVSDLSGEQIPEGKGAIVTITYGDARKGIIVLDLTDAEADQLGTKGRRRGRPGRRPKAIADKKPKKTTVYVEEVSSGSRPIEAVGTSVAA
jgi:hypothetical protein